MPAIGSVSRLRRWLWLVLLYSSCWMSCRAYGRYWTSSGTSRAEGVEAAGGRTVAVAVQDCVFSLPGGSFRGGDAAWVDLAGIVDGGAVVTELAAMLIRQTAISVLLK